MQPGKRQAGRARRNIERPTGTTKKHLAASLKANAKKMAADGTKLTDVAKNKLRTASHEIAKSRRKNLNYSRTLEIAETAPAQSTHVRYWPRPNGLTFKTHKTSICTWLEDNTLTDLRNRDENNTVSWKWIPIRMEPIETIQFQNVARNQRQPPAAYVSL